jgi:hypothetical protein
LAPTVWVNSTASRLNSGEYSLRFGMTHLHAHYLP